MDVQVLIYLYFLFLFNRRETYKVKILKNWRQGSIKLLPVLMVSLSLRDTFSKPVLENGHSVPHYPLTFLGLWFPVLFTLTEPAVASGPGSYSSFLLLPSGFPVFVCLLYIAL